MTEKLFVVTSDFKLLYKVLQTKIDGVEFRHKLPGDTITRKGKIIADHNSPLSSSSQVLKIHRNMSALQIKKRIVQFVSRREGDWELVIGIDPGHNIGLAVLHREQLVDSTIVFTSSGVVKWVKHIIKSLKPSSLLIRIGDGVARLVDEITTRLHREFNIIARIEIVDESHTSIKQSNDITIHEQAAMTIATREGYEYKNTDR